MAQSLRFNDEAEVLKLIGNRQNGARLRTSQPEHIKPVDLGYGVTNLTQTHLLKQPQKDGRNQLEKDFASDYLDKRILAGEALRYKWQACTLTLAPGVRYTADYYEVLPSPDKKGRFVILYDTKGEKHLRTKRGNRVQVRDTAAVKLKIAPTVYPEYIWLVVWRDCAGWHFQEMVDFYGNS